MNKKKLIIFLFSSLIGNYSFSQKYKEHNWIKASEHTIIPDSLLGEDAVMIQNRQYVYNDIVDIANGIFSSKRTVMQKIKILTVKGLDEYSKVFVNLYSGERITVIDARTIKPGGKEVNFKTNDIKKLNFKSPFDSDFGFQQLRFFIPDVEVGDEVEIIYTAASRNLRIGGDIILHTYIPCMSASLIYGASKAFVHEIKMYNGMPKYVDQSSETNTTLRWDMTGLPSIGDQHRAVYTREIPYVRYVIRQYSSQHSNVDIAKNNWDNVYNNYLEYYNAENETKFLKHFIQTFKDKSPKKDSIEIVKDINQFICDSITFRKLEDKEDKKPLGYYIENKFIDEHHLHILYNRLFKILGINYYFCFGRNKYDGDIDRDFVAPHIIDHVFYSFYEKDKVQLVYPGYRVNEFPVSIGGTKILMLSKSKTKSMFNFCEIIETMVPFHSPEVNYKIKKINFQVDNINDTAFNTTSNISLSGVYATIYKESHLEKIKKGKYEFYSELLLNKDFVIDSVYIENNTKDFPFDYTINSIHKTPLKFDQIDDNVYNINLEQLLNVSTLDVSNKKRYLDYFTKYLYNDASSIKLSFKQSVKIENIDNLKKLSLSNSFGSITIGVKQEDEHSISIDVSYQISKPFLKSKNYNQLVELDEAFNNMLTQKISLSTY